MAVNFRDEAPDIVKDFLFYLQTIKEVVLFKIGLKAIDILL